MWTSLTKDAVIQGLLRTLRAWPVVLVYYGMTLTLGLLIAVGFREVLVHAFGSSGAMLSMAEGFDFTVFSDFLRHHGSELTTVVVMVMWMYGTSALLVAVMAGGIISRLVRLEESVPTAEFLKACGMYAGRFLRLFLLGIAVMLFVTIVWSTLVSTISDVLFEPPESDLLIIALKGVVVLVTVIPPMGISIALDYGRILTVWNNERSMVRALLWGMKFVGRNYPAVLGFQTAVWVASGILVALYWFVEGLFDISNPAGILLMVVVHQAFIFLRVLARVWTTSGEIFVWNERQEYLHVKRRPRINSRAFIKSAQVIEIPPLPPVAKRKRRTKKRSSSRGSVGPKPRPPSRRRSS